MVGLVILTTTPDLKSARRLARVLVQKKLAACVSLRGGFVSLYRWKGKLETSREVLLLIKTVRTKFSPVEKLIRATHPYELPEIIGLPIVKGSADYLSWLNKLLR